MIISVYRWAPIRCVSVWIREGVSSLSDLAELLNFQSVGSASRQAKPVEMLKHKLSNEIFFLAVSGWKEMSISSSFVVLALSRSTGDL